MHVDGYSQWARFYFDTGYEELAYEMLRRRKFSHVQACNLIIFKRLVKEGVYSG